MKHVVTAVLAAQSCSEVVEKASFLERLSQLQISGDFREIKK